ncbi:Serine/threonine kinase [Coemansia javaensis]|uniref:protein kinase C n=1 Tax=Coemansia javaensis TaxID=2761396 RepID=A0A9W8LKB9_9FUNG|nr:Serine/threonine kinase [Coemansia javaensis]
MQASSIQGHTGDLDSAISKARDNLDRERIMLEKARHMVSQVSNPNAKANAQNMVRETEQRVSYLEAEFRRLSQKRDDKNSIKSTGDGRSSPGTAVSDRTAGGRPRSTSLSKLDLRKASSHLSGQKISLKVHEIAYKLEVERKIRDKANNIRSLYTMDHQKGGKSKGGQIAKSDQVLHESNDRIRLLEYSLKKYQSLYVDYADLDDDDDTANEDAFAGNQYQPGIRRPITGKLKLRIHRARNLQRAPIRAKAFRSPQQFVVVNIDGRPCGTTPIVKDSAFNHYFEIDVKKASELELSIFERGDKDYLIGLMWVRLSEIHEDIRKQEIAADPSSGWATAEQVALGDAAQPQRVNTHGSAPVPAGPRAPGQLSGAATVGAQPAEPGVLSEWDVESQGQIELWMNFVKAAVKRRPQSRLGRKAAVRKRRGPCIEMCGHHFYGMHTYSIMRCAICSEHIVNEAGQQCDDCHLFAHQKCIGRVVANCHFGDAADDVVELGHRIPHRWEHSTNIGANWCSHCGNMLPIGRRAYKCTECSTTCHAGCKDYLPNLCGLDMMKASAMLMEIKRAKGAAHQPKLVTKRDTVAKRPLPSAAAGQGADGQVAEVQDRFAQMQPPSAAGQLQPQPQPQPQPQSQFGAGPPSASPISPRIGQGILGYQRTDSNEFVPIRSGGGAPASAGPPGQMQHQLYQQQAPSYYQQQIQQAKGGQGPYSPQPYPPQQQPYPPQPYPPQQQQQPYPPQQQQQQQAYSPQQQQQQQAYSPRQQQQQLHPQQLQQPYPLQQQQQYGHQSPYAAGGQALPPNIGQDVRQQIHQAMQAPAKTAPAAANQPPRKVGIDDFRFLKVLGKGNFGKVMLSEEKSSSKLYAIKVLKKEFIVENDEFESTRSEKRVLTLANRERHPFLIGLHSCFQTSNHIFFVMEYISGGDLMMHVQKMGAFGERRAKFFACEILLGLGYFHKVGIIYRDLKLDNIMVDDKGHIKIADYGLCKENMGYGQTTMTFCGTPEFMAPEIVMEQRYGRAVDWWAFGVLIYEMILGTSPFHGDDENEIFDSILEDEILYPVRMSRDSVFVCQALLERDPTKRLGSGPNDAEDIMKHPFFAGTNWDDVLNKRITPPYTPEIRDRFDVSNFDPEFTNERPGLTPTNTIIDKHDQKEFADFDYVSPWAGTAEKWTR